MEIFFLNIIYVNNTTVHFLYKKGTVLVCTERISIFNKLIELWCLIKKYNC